MEGARGQKEQGTCGKGSRGSREKGMQGTWGAEGAGDRGYIGLRPGLKARQMALQYEERRVQIGKKGDGEFIS